MLDWPLKKRWAIASGCFSLTLLPLLFPPGPLTVARDITVLLEPLDDTGHVSYLRHFQQQFASIPESENGYQVLAALPAARMENPYSPFLPPEKFYFAWSRQVPLGGIGFRWDYPPTPESIAWIDKQMAPSFDRMLGSSWSDHQPGVRATQTFHAQFEYAMSEPWTRQQCPMVANYIDYHKENFLDGLLEASARRQYAKPFQPLPEERYLSLEGENLLSPMDDHFSEVMFGHLRYLLRLQTMQMIGANRASEWTTELLQLHNLVRRRNALRGWFHMYSHRAEESFYQAYAILLQYSADNAELRAQLRTSLDNLVQPPTASEHLDSTLRLQLLDFFQSCKQNGMRSYLEGCFHLELPIPPPEVTWPSHLWAAFADWDEGARYINRWIDSLVREMKATDTTQERQRRVRQALQSRPLTAGTVMAKAFLLYYMDLYGKSQMHSWELLLNDNHYLIELQLALEDYRAEKGHYPASIDELSPRMNGEAIQLPHQSAEIEYHGTREGFILSAVQEGHWQAPPLDVHPHYFRSWNLVERSYRDLVCLGGDYRAIGAIRRQREKAEIAAMEPGEYRDSMSEEVLKAERQIVVLENLRTVGGEIADYKFKGLIDFDTKEYEPQHIWFLPENKAGDESVEIIHSVKQSFPNIFLIDIRPTAITEEGVIQLMQGLARMDPESTQPVTVLNTLSSDRVIAAFKELDSPLVALQISHTDILLPSGEISPTGPSPDRDTIFDNNLGY